MYLYIYIYIYIGFNKVLIEQIRLIIEQIRLMCSRGEVGRDIIINVVELSSGRETLLDVLQNAVNYVSKEMFIKIHLNHFTVDAIYSKATYQMTNQV